MNLSLMYGTAWKEDRTAALVTQAIEAGFRAIDTANQRRHYYEAGVGEGIAESAIPRSDLFLQSKYTYQRGQDSRLPYDPAAPISEQVHQSFESSLDHLRTDYLDSLILHGPAVGDRWSDDDREAWAAMEAIHGRGKVRHLGVSNVETVHVEALLKECAVAPSFVQNRCYASRGWDRDMRELCRKHGVTYQGFSLLTANRAELGQPSIQRVADRHGATVAQVVFRAMQQLDVLPLTGTTSRAHMREDLRCSEIELTSADLAVIESCSA